jgi:hypothetical protein
MGLKEPTMLLLAKISTLQHNKLSGLAFPIYVRSLYKVYEVIAYKSRSVRLSACLISEIVHGFLRYFVLRALPKLTCLPTILNLNGYQNMNLFIYYFIYLWFIQRRCQHSDYIASKLKLNCKFSQK